METKRDIEFNSVNLNALNESGIASKKFEAKLHPVWKISTDQSAYRLYLNGKIKQQFQWFLSENKMFQRPRRRKVDRKSTHQGHNLRHLFAKMPCITDNLPADDLIFVQIHQFMLKSSVVNTMWNI